MPSEIQIATRYLRLAARAWGPDEGLPVLALHGWLDNAASFDLLAPLLPEIRLIALDLPGHGLSGWRPPGMHYHFIDFIADVVAAADALHWDRFALLGHSLGAGISSFVAATIPERITHLGLIEGLGPLSGDPSEGPRQLARSLSQMDDLEQKNPPVYGSLKEAILARHEGSDLTRSAAAIITARGTQPVAKGVSWRSDPRLTFKSPIYLTEEQVLAFLGAIQAPTLLIRGEKGYLINRAFMTERFRRVPQLEMRMLPGGHHLHLEEPEPIAAALAEFYRSAAGSPLETSG
ncbi:MAG: alpha/beta hydrolase [Gammaproteobacteria bacterium]|nr:alpha/beta hydrolase [Gammaproteobacteria bacterium]MCP5424040.1 alpha/beta hydrolase [Gammaproteobacteria bacterium]MCP5459526.1 alpha/beta hydrolase [Gammaproteobacteria bacterium]